MGKKLSQFIRRCAGLFSNVWAADNSHTREELLKNDSEEIRRLSKQIKFFYDMPEYIDIQDVTKKVLDSDINSLRKETINSLGRRIYVFTYPSDGLKIKGYISFIPQIKNQPIILFLRGGNREFGLPNPGGDLACLDNYTIVATTNRGGVSEGIDEFGGGDVNDVKNLVDFLPELEKKLNVPLVNEKMYMVGASRGGMQMFLALARFPALQTRILKIVALSGLLDIRQAVQDRQDMKQIFIDDFGLIENVNENKWLDLRDPLLAVTRLRSNLPVLIVQGTKDLRITLDEGYQMVHALELNGNPVTYWEIKGGDHCLANQADRWEMINKWLLEG